MFDMRVAPGRGFAGLGGTIDGIKATSATDRVKISAAIISPVLF
jgi:hypothetical protein